MTDPNLTFKKSTSPADRKLEPMDLIYWDGDNANPSHLFLVLSVTGAVARIRDICGSFNCESNGREQSLPVALVYSSRWGFQDERNAARRQMLIEMRKKLAERRKSS